MDITETGIPVLHASEESARQVFLAWERLRLTYNAALAILVLAFSWNSLLDRDFWSYLFWGAFGANVCFCLGPVAEGYLVLLGADRRVARWIVFVPGLLLGFLLTLAALYSWDLRDF